MKYKNIATLSVIGMAGLSGCTATQNTEKEQMSEISLPQQGIVTEACVMNTCDNSEKSYYIEIDTNATRKGPEFAAITYFACGMEQFLEAQRKYPKGAVIDLNKSAPIVSRLVKLDTLNGEPEVIMQKQCVDASRLVPENERS